MKALVVYDSVYGNTEKAAQAIGDGLRAAGADVTVSRAAELSPAYLSGVGLLVVGSPTQQFRPMKPILELLAAMPARALSGVRVAAFDTRMTEAEIKKNGILNFFVGMFGHAAKGIDGILVKKGGASITEPQGFYVAGMEGPLVDGELERATAWGRGLAAGRGGAGSAD